MRKRTPEQKRQNVVYQLRHRKRKRFNLKALELLELVNTHWPIGVEPSEIRRITVRINHIMRLPYRWTDDDLARAYAALEKLKKELYSEDCESFTHEYHTLMTLMLDAFKKGGGTTDERVKVALEMMRLVGTEMNNQYGGNRPIIKDVLPLAMASGMTPCAQWVKYDLAKFIVENFSEEERQEFCKQIL